MRSGKADGARLEELHPSSICCPWTTGVLTHDYCVFRIVLSMILMLALL